MLPVGQWVQFNVTSLDVIHSFWAYQLGVKADANPGVNNVAYTKPTSTGRVHGPLRRAVRALARRDVQLRRTCVSVSAFQAWAVRTEAQLAPMHQDAAAVRHHLRPDRDPARSTRPWPRPGITGANGYYYPPQDPVQP